MLVVDAIAFLLPLFERKGDKKLITKLLGKLEIAFDTFNSYLRTSNKQFNLHVNNKIECGYKQIKMTTNELI